MSTIENMLAGQTAGIANQFSGGILGQIGNITNLQTAAGNYDQLLGGAGVAGPSTASLVGMSPSPASPTASLFGMGPPQTGAPLAGMTPGFGMPMMPGRNRGLPMMAQAGAGGGVASLQFLRMALMQIAQNPQLLARLSPQIRQLLATAMPNAAPGAGLGAC